jgi:hypothetical protein
MANSGVSNERSMAAYDPSHDFLHVNRVRHTSMRIAKRILEEKPDAPINIFVVELAALFHDLFEYVTTNLAPYISRSDILLVPNTPRAMIAPCLIPSSESMKRAFHKTLQQRL